ncbi:MAG: hypothetical protein K6B14_09785 [Lachnospiraceae bacterium]|nr:hypothetical protein [Lachnospiraceae bacterium]
MLESGSRLIDSMKTSAEMAQWYEEKVTRITDAKLESAYEPSRQKAFGDAALMDSHQSKRKKSYMEKAKFQMEASWDVKKSISDRSGAAQVFFRNNEDVDVPKEYMGFIEDLSTILPAQEYIHLKNLFSGDEQTQKEAALHLLDRINVHLHGMDKFEFQDDHEFLYNFEHHYPALFAVSTADNLLDFFDEGKVDRRVVELRAKIEVCKDIREAYENRIQIMQSPYYALLLNSDLNEEDPQYKQLKEKVKDNPGAKALFDAVEKRGKLKFGKGMSTRELYQKKLGESKDYEKISEHIKGAEDMRSDLAGLLRKSIPSDPKELIAQINEIVTEYREMNSSLASRIAELENIGALSGKEMAEYKLAQERIVQYKEEQQLFEIAAAQIKVGKLEPVPGVWENVLYNIRAIKIDVDDPKLEMVGGGASTLYKVKEGDKKYFVKRQQRLLGRGSEMLSVQETVSNASVHVARMLKNLKEYVGGNDKLVGDILTAIGSSLSQLANTVREDLPKEATEQQMANADKRYVDKQVSYLMGAGFAGARRFWDLFLEGDNVNMVGFEELIRGSYKKYNEYTNSEYAEITPGAVISDRNVSTSVMAKSLGLSDIVAESKTVLLDNGDGTFAKANAMEEVKGMEFAKFLASAKLRNCSIEYSPQALGQIFSMQVLDMICGQVDRHINNYMVTDYEKQRVTRDGKTTEVWVVKHIKAIDNDLAFGNLTGRDVVFGTHSNLMGFTTKSIDANTVKYLPAEMVRRLRYYKDHPEALKADFTDTRSEEEIGALQSRILVVLDQIDTRTADDATADQKLVLYENEAELEEKYRQMQSLGVFTRMKTKTSGLGNSDKPQFMDWSFVRDVPADETEVREKIADQDHGIVVEDVTYEHEGDNILNVDAAHEFVEEEDTETEKEVQQPVQTKKEGLYMDFEAAREELLQSKVSHMFVTYSDSKEMEQVKKAIVTLNTQLQKPVVKGVGFDKAKKPLCYAYEDLIRFCDKYITHITSSVVRGHGHDGARRLKLARQIMETSRLELAAFNQMTQEELGLDEVNTANTWSDVLYNFRGIRMSLGDPHVTVLGAGTSVVYRMEEEDKSTKYVKIEEKLLPDGKNLTRLEGFRNSGEPGAEELVDIIMEGVREKAKAICETEVKAFVDEPEAWLELVDSWFRGMDGDLQAAIEETIPWEADKSEKKYKEFVKQKRYEDTWRAVNAYLGFTDKVKKYFWDHPEIVESFGKYYFKKGLSYDTAKGAGIAPGEEIPSRNVSTSRLAKRLDVSDIIAESQTVVLRRDDGKLVRANAMEGVETRTMANLQQYCAHEGITVKMSAKAVKQLMNLQLFDIICGQVDRNTNNYSVFYELSKDGKTATVTSIKGIDNDMAFGDLEYGANNGKLMGLEYWKKCAMPFMDEAFYNRIVGLTRADIDQIAMEQLDIRKPEEIVALKLRIISLQDDLKKRKKDGEITLLSDDSQWEGKLDEMKRLYASGKMGKNYLHINEMIG